MAITVLNNPTQQKKVEATSSSFEKVRKAAIPSQPKQAAKPLPKPVSNPVPKATHNSFEKVRKAAKPLSKLIFSNPVPKAPVSFNEKPSTINNNIIKPKYIQDSSVVYKKSSYIKDLLGEGK